jgi:hypothetical protein
MNCLKDYIGIRGYDVAPASGLFINQLQGISLKSIQLISDSEQVTFVAVWDDVQGRAWLRLRSDFLIAMRAKYCIEKDVQVDDIICADKELFARCWLYVLASELMQERLFSERINKLTTIDREAGLELEALFAATYRDALETVMTSIHYQTQELSLSRTYNRVERLP